MRVALVVAAVALVVAAVAAACGPRAPGTAPPVQTAATDAVELRYAAQPLVQDVELELTHTSVGQYVEANLQLQAALELAIEGDVLRTRWTLQGVKELALTGTVAPDEHHQARGLLLARGKGMVIGDVRGVVDTAATEADAINVARQGALDAKAPPSGVLLMTVLAEQIRLPRLPAQPLRVGEPVELEEESETVVVDADAELVLPTTTVHRFTLRRIDEAGASAVAEIAIEIASVAQPEGEAPEATARVESRTEGTLLFDLDQGIPVSLELTRTESFEVGEATAERSLRVRSQFRSP
jgi:hypothetical protein